MVPEPAHLAHPLGRVVENLGEFVAEMLDDPARDRGPDAFNLRREVALDRRRLPRAE